MPQPFVDADAVVFARYFRISAASSANGEFGRIFDFCVRSLGALAWRVVPRSRGLAPRRAVRSPWSACRRRRRAASRVTRERPSSVARCCIRAATQVLATASRPAHRSSAPFSSSSSRRSSMSRRMARPPMTRKPAAARKPRGRLASISNEVRPGCGGGGIFSSLFHTPTATRAAMPHRGAAVSANRSNGAPNRTPKTCNARISGANRPGGSVSVLAIERAEIFAELIGDAARRRGQGVAACRPSLRSRRAAPATVQARCDARRATICRAAPEPASRKSLLELLVGENDDARLERDRRRLQDRRRSRRPTRACHAR